jgi:thiamine biosynthesis protein ThiS
MIEINGKLTEWEEGMTVEKLLARMNYTFPKIVVRVNGKVVEKHDWPAYPVPDEAVVQAHHLIAGG